MRMIIKDKNLFGLNITLLIYILITNIYSFDDVCSFINQINNFLDPIDTNFSILFSNWYSYSKWLTFCYMLCVIILIGLFLKNTGNHVKILNLTSALIFTEYLLSYGYDNFQVINLTQNFTYFAHLFIYISIFIGIIFFLSISQKNFFKENTKIEFTLLVWCIIIAAQYLISSLDFISIIILLECIAFSSYVLVGFDRKNKFSVTSGLQYLILASIPGGLFILGLVLFYNNFGTFTQTYLISLLESLETIPHTIKPYQNWEVIFNTNLIYWPTEGEILPYGEDTLLALILLLDYSEYFFNYINWFFSIITPEITLYLIEILLNSVEHAKLVLLTTDLFNIDKSSFEEYKTVIWFLVDLINNIYFPETNRLFLLYNMSLGLIEGLSILLNILYSFYSESIFNEKSPLDFFFKNFDLMENLLEGPTNYMNICYWLLFLNDFYFNIEILKEIDIDPLWEGLFPPYIGLNGRNSDVFDEFFSVATIIWSQNFSKENVLALNWIIYDEDTFDTFISLIQTISSPISQTLDTKITDTIGGFIYSDNIYDALFNTNAQTKGFLMQIYDWTREYFDLCKCKPLFITHSHPFAFEINLLIAKSNIYENTSNFHDIQTSYIYLYLAVLFILANLSFKLTAAPFHFWAPSVYGGSPLVTLTFLSIFSKTIFIFFSIWLFVNVFESLANIWQILVIIIAVLSIFISIIGAFSEKIFKRFFVYSSTGHVGFMLLGFATLNITGLKGTVDYLILYILSSFIVWFIIMHLSKKTITLINLKGLSYNQPYLSLIFSIILFSLSGIPPLGGFFVKYEIFYSLINSSFFFLAYLLLLLTIVSFFYYIRLIKIFYFENNKKFYKFKNFDDIKLRLISYLFFIVPFFMLFSDNAISIIITNILIKSLF